MADDGGEDARAWLVRWHDMTTPQAEVDAAVAAARARVRALDAAAARLGVDDDPWRWRAVLRARAPERP